MALLTAPAGRGHAAEPHDAAPPAQADARVQAAREQLMRHATERARRAGLTAGERAVYRELLREAFRHVLDEDMDPAEIARETGASQAVVESTLARAGRHHLLDLSQLAGDEPFTAAEAMDVPWLRSLDDSSRAAMRVFFRPAAHPPHLREVQQQLWQRSDDEQRVRIAARIVAIPRLWSGVRREVLLARLLTPAECNALRAAAAPESLLVTGSRLQPGAAAPATSRGLRALGVPWTHANGGEPWHVEECDPPVNLAALCRLAAVPTGRAGTRSSRRR